MPGYRLTPKARNGFLNILAYVETEFGVQVAERVLDELEAAFKMLAENPGIGHIREDLTLDNRLLFWTVGPTLIAYRTAANTIEILLVERGERDWERLLEEILGRGR